MTQAAISLLLACTLSGCAIYDSWLGPREALRQPATILIPETYTKAEIDAINAEITCKSLARNQLQAARCGTRR